MMIEDQLTRLATLPPADLSFEWQERFGEHAPDLSPSLLRRVLAYHVQEQMHGGLPASILRMLSGLAGSGRREPQARLKPGTRLLREWNGVVHSVLVTDDGLLFRERRYASLSQIAKEITGAHWSGPRFFGIKPRPNPPVQRSADHG